MRSLLPKVSILPGDFSAPFHWLHETMGSIPASTYARNDGKAIVAQCKPRNADFIIIAAFGGYPQPSEPFEPSEPSYNMFGRGRLKDLSLLDLSPLQHEHAFGIMVIGAIEDIPLNHV